MPVGYPLNILSLPKLYQYVKFNMPVTFLWFKSALAFSSALIITGVSTTPLTKGLPISLNGPVGDSATATPTQ